MPSPPGQSPTVTDLIRSFLATCLEPRPDHTVEAAALCTAYRQWSRWQGCDTLSDANFLRVTGAVLGQAGLDGPIETVTGYALRDDPILRFLLERTRLQADARISVNALYVAYLCWLDDAPRHGRQGSFHDQVSPLIGPSETGPARHAPGPVRLWLGLTLDDGLPEDAIAPGDLTDAAELRARPLNRREVA